MGRVIFFIREGLRALRRSAAPSLAAIVTVAVTVLLLGVLIPVLQTTNGKTNEVRDQVGLRIFLTDASTQQDIEALRAKLQAIPHVNQVEFVSKDQALQILSDRL
jgi:cell division transport system permease protein